MQLSLILMVWNTGHLLARTLHTLKKQTLDDWELIVVDDNSEDDVPLVLRQNGEGLPIEYHRLEHEMGMRGNTVSLNYGIEQARGDVVLWSTPEVMLPPGALEAMYTTHVTRPNELLWVTIPSHGLTADMQLRIDEVDWQSCVHNIKQLVDGLAVDDWNSVWFHLNFYENGRRDTAPKLNYGNNQTVAVMRQEWLDTVGSFPFFCDYGCLAGDTRVLTADLQWVRNDSVRVGDYLVGVTEFPAGRKRRKFEKSLVTKIGEVQLPSYRILTDDGKDIIASDSHRWLVTVPRTGSMWKRTDQLEVGDAIRRVTDMWDQPGPFESGWIAGMLDGDGSAETGSGLRVAIIQNPGPVLQHVTETLSKWGIDYNAQCRYNGKKGRWGSKRDGRAVTVRTKNTATAMRLLGMAPCVRLRERWIGVAFPLGRGEMKSRVVHIEPMGVRTLIGMQTSTRTFVAEGLASHNSDDPWIARERGRHGYTDVTLWNQEGYHQWHTTCQYWMALGKAPNWNAKAHTTSNVANDPRVPKAGTCEIWDHCDRSPLTEAQIEDALRQGPMVAATGFRPKAFPWRNTGEMMAEIGE